MGYTVDPQYRPLVEIEGDDVGNPGGSEVEFQKVHIFGNIYLEIYCNIYFQIYFTYIFQLMEIVHIFHMHISINKRYIYFTCIFNSQHIYNVL